MIVLVMDVRADREMRFCFLRMVSAFTKGSMSKELPYTIPWSKNLDTMVMSLYMCLQKIPEFPEIKPAIIFPYNVPQLAKKVRDLLHAVEVDNATLLWTDLFNEKLRAL